MERENNSPKIGMLCWEAGHIPRGLVQTESLRGSSTNPDSFDFPVRYCRVKGANIQTILEKPDRDVLQTMIAGARAMVTDGVCAITTSCGFNAIFQEELANAVDVPVFTSSLLQVPLVRSMLGENRAIGVITAKKAALRKEHLRAVGITEDIPLRIFGLEDCREWGKIFRTPDDDVDLKLIEDEVVGVALKAKRRHPEIGAFVLECTDLPPFAQTIREGTECPVFDIVTMTNYVYQAIGE